MSSLANMKLGVRLALATSVVMAFFVLALGAAVNGLVKVGDRFGQFIEHDDALARSISGAYAQGLQMGQALRNIILDPANKTAYQNMDAARDAFKKDLDTGLMLAKSEPETLKVLERVAQLRSKHQLVQQAVVKAAQENQAAAIQMLNKEETPLWRDIRALLIDLTKLKSGQVAAEGSQTVDYTKGVLRLILGLSAAALAAGLVVMYWLTRSITRQLGGEPAYAAEVASRVAAGDLSVDVEVKANDNSSLLASMKYMRRSLLKIVSEVRSGTEAIGSGTSEIARGNADLSQRTEEQASSLEETASSMEELTSTVKQNAENARQANQLAASASEVAAKGGTVVSEVVGTMNSINESSKKIVDIIGVIDGIAFQTNILALNAAVEAARAGEQGRGFAVVASEVRSLAQRSAAAAKEIKALIGDSVDKVGAGTKLVDEAGKTMEEIVASVKRVTDIMSEIAAASQEQGAGIEQVNRAVTQMDEVTQQNAALVEQAAAAAESLEEQAQNLAQAVAVFKVGDEAAGSPVVRSQKPDGKLQQPAGPAPERRGPNRAPNVARLPTKGTKPKAVIAKVKAASGGGDGQWEEF